jgi:hypothetical protein
MSWTEQEFELLPTSEHSVSTVDGHDILFLGDRSELSLDTRRALVKLLSGPSLEARRHSKLWSALISHEEIIRSRLSELFLGLVIDRDLQVAFTRQLDVGDLETPILLRSIQLTFIDSVLILYLRQKLAQADAHGIRAVVATEEIEEDLTLYERNVNTDHAGFTKRIRASIEKVKKYNLIQKIRSSETRFEVSPTLKLLFSAEEIQALTRQYKSLSPDVLQPSELGDQPLLDSNNEENAL